jgi:M6 family metalloprotease-like protein
MRNFKKEVPFFSSVLFILLFNIILPARVLAAPLYFEPVSKSLPDGTTLSLFMSGDEFFNYLHDKNGFPIGAGTDGYYYYLIQDKDNFLLTTFRAGVSDPFQIPGIKTVTIPSFVREKRIAYEKQMEESSVSKGVKSYNKSSGTFNNLVIYIRFYNEPEFTVQRSAYETKLNSLTGTSLRYYYREVSYNKLDVVSYNFPGGGTSNIYYTDFNTRSYYQPYNVSTNPDGYKNDTERASREHMLLSSAIDWSTRNYTLPEGVNFDMNQDGIFDNICFVVRGSSDAWNDLLWPHRWVLYTRAVKIGNLKVYGYTLQMENVSVNTFCHEMFHALGAPDLYHYDNTDKPVGPWDIMANGSCHPGAWMKYKYGGWIDNVPEISESGTYIIKALQQEKNNSYLIRSPYRTDQFFILEFRKKSGTYEANVPSSGLIIQRVDTRYHGNSKGPPDEIYIYRKNGGPALAGDINSAYFSDLSGRTAFTDNSNPFAFFQEGGQTGINISNIVSMGDSMSFSVDIDRPVEFALTPVEDNRISGTWKSLSSKEFIIVASPGPETFTPRPGIIYSPGDTIGQSGKIIQKTTTRNFLNSDLESDRTYYYMVCAVKSSNPAAYSDPVYANCKTGIYTIINLPHEENFDNIISDLPRGWKSVSGTSGWQLYSASPFSSPNSILLLNPGQSSDEWMFTPGFELAVSNKYMISFRYRNKSPGVRESLVLKGGTDRTSGMGLYNLFSSDNFLFKDYALYKSVFTPVFNGANYFGFKVSSSNQGVLIDDFRIEKVPQKTIQHYNPAEFYPNPTTGKITIPATGNIKVTVLRSDGKMVLELEIESMQEVDLSSLGKGLFLIRFTDNQKTVTRKIIIL